MVTRLPLVLSLFVAVLIALPGSALADGARDQIVVSGDVNVPDGRTVGDVVVLDGAVDVRGRVDGDVIAVGGPVRIAGRVDGSVTAVSDRITLLGGAHVGEDVLYGDEQPLIAPTAVVGGEISDEGWSEVTGFPWGAVGLAAWWLAVSVSALVLGLVLLALAPRAADSARAAVSSRIGPVLAWGLGLFVGLPIVAVVALVTLVGIPLGVVLLLALLPLGGIAYVTTAYVLGRRLVKEPTSRMLAFLAGLGVLRLLALVPILSTLTWIAAVVVGIGALLVALWGTRTPAGAPAAPAAEPPPGAAPGYPQGPSPA